MPLFQVVEWTALFGGMVVLCAFSSIRLKDRFPASKLLRRIVVATILWTTLYSFPWIGARSFLASTIVDILGVLGIPSVAIGVDMLTVRVHLTIDVGCMYACLWCLVSPLLWHGRSLWQDLIRVTVAAIVICIMNLGRITFAVAAYDAGVHFFLAHDVVDYILYTGTYYGCLVWCISELAKIVKLPPRDAWCNSCAILS